MADIPLASKARQYTFDSKGRVTVPKWMIFGKLPKGKGGGSLSIYKIILQILELSTGEDSMKFFFDDVFAP